MPMSFGGRAASSSGCAIRPRGHETGSTGSIGRTPSSSPTGHYVMATAEHREPCGACLSGSLTKRAIYIIPIPPLNSVIITGGHFRNSDHEMLAARREILGLALLFAMIGDSSGQSKPEPPRQNSSGPQQRTDTEQPDTDQAPPSIIIKTPSPEQTQTKPTANEQKGPDNQSETWGLSDKIAVAASVFALLQFFALIATVCIMMCTAKRQLRAYIGVFVKRVPTVVVDTSPSAILSYKNFGQTPANKVRYWCKMIIEPYPSNPRFPAEPFREERL